MNHLLVASLTGDCLPMTLSCRLRRLIWIQKRQLKLPLSRLRKMAVKTTSAIALPVRGKYCRPFFLIPQPGGQIVTDVEDAGIGTRRIHYPLSLAKGERWRELSVIIPVLQRSMIVRQVSRIPPPYFAVFLALINMGRDKPCDARREGQSSRCGDQASSRLDLWSCKRSTGKWFTRKARTAAAAAHAEGSIDMGEREIAALIAQLPAARRGTPNEIVNAVVFVASDEAAFRVGSELIIDGGMSML